MDILFTLIGILFLISALAGFIFFIIYMARKIGLLKAPDGDGQTDTLGELNRYFQSAKNKLAFRFIVIAALTLLLNIPLQEVTDVVRERSRSYHQVLDDIAATWGRQQTLQGPLLLIPYTETIITTKVVTADDGSQQTVQHSSLNQKTAVVLPDALNLNGQINGQTRQRGLYQSQVYSADLTLTGAFTRPKLQQLSNHIETIHWDKAWLAVGLSDTQAINQVSALQWGTDQAKAGKIGFEPGARIMKMLPNGFHAPLNLSNEQQRYPFSFQLQINGSKGFYFSPVAKTTQAQLQSDWPHPSFQGDVLPKQHQIDADGFSAHWSIPHLARNYPQLWTLENEDYAIAKFRAGVNIFESVSLYAKVTRAIKYASLFILLTYITFLVFEVSIGKRLHIVQYGIIGLALAMFYLTLLSMAEHAGFAIAYLAAALLIIAMISCYAYSAIRSISRTTLITLSLSGLYLMLFILLRLEDHALLGGTILLLVILAVLMYLTRNMNRVETIN